MHNTLSAPLAEYLGCSCTPFTHGSYAYAGTYESCLHPLTYFFNLCLHTATFPDCLKVALVIPTFKSGDKHKFANYHPISLLSVFSKILEKLLHDNLSSFLEETSILFEHQFGFRKKTRHLYAHRSYCRRSD